MTRLSQYNTSVSEFSRGKRKRRSFPPDCEALDAPAEQSVWLRLLSLLKKQDSLPPVRGADMRSLGPVHVCSCGCEVFNVMACFEDYELVWYFLDATCVSCGNLVQVPCPVDKNESQSN